MANEIPVGRFVWHDLMTTDPEGARKFYTSLVGWGTEIWEGGKEPYTMWTAGGTPIGGYMVLPDEAREGGAPTHWLGYVATADADATLEKARGMGARVYVPMQAVPTVGRFAVLADPQGAAFAIYTPENPLPETNNGATAVGRFSWHELATTDPDAAWTFYSQLVGWSKTEEMDMGEAGVYRMFGEPGGPPRGGIFRKPADVPGPSAWLHYIKVASVDRSAEEIATLRGTILNGPMDVPGGDRIVQCLDPQGGVFALHSSAHDEASTP